MRTISASLPTARRWTTRSGPMRRPSPRWPRYRAISRSTRTRSESMKCRKFKGDAEEIFSPPSRHKAPMPRNAARLIGVSLLVAACVFVAVTAVGLGFRAYRQHLAAETLAIRSPNGVQEAGFVDIGGIKQWIQIRGENRDNPIL